MSAPPGPAAARRAGRRRVWTLAALALLAASQALLWWAWYGQGPKQLIGDEGAYLAAAQTILAGGPWHASTIWPPLQPLLIAAVLALAGPHLIAVQLLQTAMLIGCAALLRSLWRRIDGRVAAANLAAALFLINPGTAAYAHWLWPEVVHLLLILTLLRLLASDALQPARAALAGACLGLALLAKSLLAGFWPVLLLAFAGRDRRRARLLAAAAFLLAAGCVTAPAWIQGWRDYGKPMIADSSVYNLWIGLTDRWRSDYVQDMGGVTLPAFMASGDTPAARNAATWAKIDALIAERGLLPIVLDQLGRQYFRLFNAKTPLVSQLPGPACAGHLSAYRTAPWLTATLTAANGLLHSLILAAAAFGLIAWRRRPDRIGWLLALFAAYQLALMLPLHVKARFLFPLLPLLCGLAASWLASLARRHAADTATGQIALTPLRLGAGAALAALALALAWLGPVLDGTCPP